VIGQPIPHGKPGLALALLRQVGQQVIHRLHERLIRPPRDSHESALFLELVNLHRAGLELNAYRVELLAAAYNAVRSLNLAERHGDAQLRVVGYASIGYFLVLTPLKSLSAFYLDQGHALAKRIAGTAAHEVLLRAASLSYESMGDQPRALALVEQALLLAQEMGDLYGYLHAKLVQTSALLFQSRYVAAQSQAEALVARAMQPRNEFYLTIGYGILGAIALRKGRLEDAQGHLAQAQFLLRSQQVTLLPVFIHCISLLCKSRRGEVATVLSELPAALDLVETTDLTAHHVLDGYPGVVEVCLLTWQRARKPDEKAHYFGMYTRALRALRRYARIFPIGLPALHLLTGRYQLACGATDRARRSFLVAQEHAEHLGMSHEAALAAAWYGRSLGGGAGRAKMEAAFTALRQLGAAWDEELE
jgi:hypothetical protein